MRATRKKAKPGEVLFFFGRLAGDSPDHIGMWGGEGATKRHSNFVMGKFNRFLEELDAAGFDTTTIEFKICVKKPAPNST